jgi:hypothetical protein
MSYEDDDGIDDYLENVNAIWRQGLEDFGVDYIKVLQRLVYQDDELITYKNKIDQFFKKLLGFAEKKGANLSRIHTVENLEDFGFPINDEGCYAALLRIISDNDIARELSPPDEMDNENYASDEFEAIDDDDGKKEDFDDDIQYFAQNKGDLAVEDYLDEHSTFKIPGPSSEPKLTPDRYARNDYKHQVMADAKRPQIYPMTTTNNILQSKELPPSMRSSTGNKKRNPTWITERRWVLSDQIGEGAFGQVFKCLDDMVSGLGSGIGSIDF